MFQCNFFIDFGVFYVLFSAFAYLEKLCINQIYYYYYYYYYYYFHELWPVPLKYTRVTLTLNHPHRVRVIQYSDLYHQK